MLGGFSGVLGWMIFAWPALALDIRRTWAEGPLTMVVVCWVALGAVYALIRVSR
jgi:hypothetical protein